jgi:hypothetical protein
MIKTRTIRSGYHAITALGNNGVSLECYATKTSSGKWHLENGAGNMGTYATLGKCKKIVERVS